MDITQKTLYNMSQVVQTIFTQVFKWRQIFLLWHLYFIAICTFYYKCKDSLNILSKYTFRCKLYRELSYVVIDYSSLYLNLKFSDCWTQTCFSNILIVKKCWMPFQPRQVNFSPILNINIYIFFFLMFGHFGKFCLRKLYVHLWIQAV